MYPHLLIMRKCFLQLRNGRGLVCVCVCGWRVLWKTVNPRKAGQGQRKRAAQHNPSWLPALILRLSVFSRPPLPLLIRMEPIYSSFHGWLGYIFPHSCWLPASNRSSSFFLFFLVFVCLFPLNQVWSQFFLFLPLWCLQETCRSWTCCPLSHALLQLNLLSSSQSDRQAWRTLSSPFFLASLQLSHCVPSKAASLFFHLRNITTSVSFSVSRITWQLWAHLHPAKSLNS